MGCTINDIVNYAASGEVLNKKDCSLAEAKKVTEKIQHPPKKESPKSFKPTTPAQQLKAVTDPSQPPVRISCDDIKKGFRSDNQETVQTTLEALGQSHKRNPKGRA